MSPLRRQDEELNRRRTILAMAILVVLSWVFGCLCTAAVVVPRRFPSLIARRPTATATMLPTATPTATATLTATVAPTPTSTPTPTATPTRGIRATLQLREGKPEYAVGEDVAFRFAVTNQSGATVHYGFLGVKASTGSFQSAWAGDLRLEPGETLTWEDKIRLNAPGDHQLTLAMCFSPVDVCQSPRGDWATIAGPIPVKVR